MGHVSWQELLPYEFRARREACPVVYLPMGLCEPHGQISAYGLDTIKAEYLCVEAARRFGGIVAPPLGYQIHESGYHAPWLAQEVGETAVCMTSVPPFVLLYFFLYQLRAFVNAGFRGIVVLTGHSGGNQADLRLAAEAFARYVPVKLWVGSDPELVENQYAGDHAGRYEISQLLHIRPDLVDRTKAELENVEGSGGRLALGRDADEASRELGKQIMEASLVRLGEIVGGWSGPAADGLEGIRQPAAEMVDYATVEQAWRDVLERRSDWLTVKPYQGQNPVPSGSRWKPYENIG